MAQDARPAPPELDLDIDNAALVQYVAEYERVSVNYFNKEKNLSNRREVNKRFYFGRQLEIGTRTYKGVTKNRPLKTYEKPYLDNVIKEGEDILRPLVLSRIPDLIIKPGTEGNDISR